MSKGSITTDFFEDRTALPNKIQDDKLESLMSQRNAPGISDVLKNARVAIAGLGGLGSNIAVNLARIGVGFLHLVDFDVVEPSNLNRQQYKICHIGMTKADALRQEISEINPFIAVQSQCIRVTQDNAAKLFASDDIVCEAFDNPSAKAMLISTLLGAYKDKPIVAASGMAGFASGNDIKTRRIRDNLYICGDGRSEANAETGIMSPRVAICAGHQSNTVLRLILGEKGE